MVERTDPGVRRTRGDSGSAAAETEQVRSALRDTAERAKSSGKQELESRKDAAADQAEQLAGAMHRVGRESEREGQETIASYATDLASGLEKFADSLRSKSVNELANEVQTLARRNPALFVAGSIGVGFAVARFLKASQTHSHREEYAGASSADDFSEAVAVTGTDAVESGRTTEPERTPERTEYFAADTASSTPPQSYATDNPAIPTTRPGASGAEQNRPGTVFDKRDSDHG